MEWWVYIRTAPMEASIPASPRMWTGAPPSPTRGQGAKYTRSRLPVTVVWRESQPNKSAALRREAAIKRLHREEKLALIHGTVPLDIIQESEAQIL